MDDSTSGAGNILDAPDVSGNMRELKETTRIRSKGLRRYPEKPPIGQSRDNLFPYI